MKKIAIIGSTGSIGTQTLDVVRQNKKLFKIVALACKSNIDLLNQQIEEFHPKYAGVYNLSARQGEKKKSGTKYFYGEKEILELINLIECDTVVIAVTGAAGLMPTIVAIRSGKNVALATKEVMVLAGELINRKLQEKNRQLEKRKKEPINLYPIDSEHSAIWQCLRSGQTDEVERIILTCSGGPFRDKTNKELKNATPKQTLNHPTWKMGKRITVDSATLMNKGFEIIEARWLFNIPAEKIEVVVHPQSILHSAVVFKDGSIIGQFGLPDMRIPIQYALSFPARLKNTFSRLSLSKISRLTFECPNTTKFPCLNLAYEALKIGGTMSVVLNAADEIAVDLFLRKKIKFLDIPKIIFQTMSKHKIIKRPSLKEILDIDKWARNQAKIISEKLINLQ